MKIKVIKVVKPAFEQIRDLVKNYEKRLSKWIKVENIILKKEEDLSLSSDSLLVCLDEHGSLMDSIGMSSKLEGWVNDRRIKEVVLLIGGPYGISPSILNKAHERWSLSQLTFQGDLAWLILWEQIYRSFCILNKFPYHHE